MTGFAQYLRTAVMTMRGGPEPVLAGAAVRLWEVGGVDRAFTLISSRKGK